MAFLAVLLLQSVTASYLSLEPVEWVNAEEYVDGVSTLVPGAVQYYQSAYYTSKNASMYALDGIFGAVYAGGQAYQGAYQYPTSQMGYMANSQKWNANNPINGDYSQSTGYIATSYLSLDEISSGGVVVQTISLNTLPWALASTVSDGVSTSIRLTGGVSGASSTFTAFGGGGNNNNNNNNNNNQQQQQQNQNNQQVAFIYYGNLSISLIVTVTNTSGKFTTGGALLSSRSVELDIEILNFPYTNSANSIRFSEVTATSTMDQTIATNTLWTGFWRTSVGTTDLSNSVSGVYFDLSSKAYVDGVAHDVSRTSWSGTYTDMRNYKLYAVQLQQMSKQGRVLNYFGNNITFPAGASNIIYRQTYGTGSGPVAPYVAPVEELHSEASESFILGMSKPAFGGLVAGSVIGFMLLVLAGVFYCRSRGKRADYPAAINETTNSPTKSETTDQTENTGLIASEGQSTKYQALA